MEAFRWGVIGAGIIANKVMGEITAYEQHSLGGVFSRTFDKAKKLTDRYGGLAYRSVEELLTAPHIDCIYIATPHSEHYLYMLKCIEFNKPFLCEKALTVNSAQAKRVFELAEQKQVYGAEAMWTRFNPVVRDILEIVRSGELGEVKSLKADFSVPMSLAPHTQRVYSPNLAGGALLDLGVYPVSYAQMLLGSPISVESVTVFNKSKTDAGNKIKLVMQNSAVCNLSCSFNKLGGVSAKIELEKGTIYSPLFYRPCKAVIKSNGKKTVIKGANGYIHQFDKVAYDIRLGRLQSKEIPHEDSVAVMAILDKIRQNANFKYPENIEKLYN